MYTFGVFAVPFIVRPIGGLIFEPLGNRIGRTKVALVVLGLPTILLLRVGGLGATFGGLMIMGLTLVLFSAVSPSTLPALFPTEFCGTAATVIATLVLVSATSTGLATT